VQCSRQMLTTRHAAVGSAAAPLEPTYVGHAHTGMSARDRRSLEAHRPSVDDVWSCRARLTRMRYRRSHIPGATVFLTLVTLRRAPLLQDANVRSALRSAVAHVAARHPFRTLAFVVLPDHCHLLWQLPEHDGDFSLRVRLLKHHMSRRKELSSPIWQKRFWEHLIRDEDDLRRHLDYIHYNPVKHGHVRMAREWADSSFQHFVERGAYAKDWGIVDDLVVRGE